MEKNNNIIIITGCDSGIGKNLAKILSSYNYKIIITYLEKNPFIKNKNILAYKVDLKNENNILTFVKEINSLYKQGFNLYYLINNAGIALGGPFENIPLKIVRDVFEVNFFGLISLTQKLIPLLINNKGRIIITGSMAGRIALPFLSPYNSTKFALEGFSDSLRRELNPFGVKTTLLDIGGVNTPIWKKAKKQDISFVEKKYLISLKEFEKNFIDSAQKAMDPEKAAKQIIKILFKKNPKPRYIIADNKFTTYLPTLIPTRLFDKIVSKLFKMDYGK
jgi:short-subunit dehydrogenase